MSSLCYPSVKQAPIQGYTGFGGGATSAAFRSGSVPPFDNYRMFAPKNSIAISALTVTGRSGMAVYPCKSTITENSDFEGNSGTSLPTSSYFDSPTPTLASLFGVASNVSTTVNISVADQGGNSYSNANSSGNNWNEYPRNTGLGVFISGFWMTTTDDLGSWKTGMSGQHAFPSGSTLADSGANINGNAASSPGYVFSDAVGSEAADSTSGGMWVAGFNPSGYAGGADNSPYAQFIFNSGLGSAVGFAVAGYNSFGSGYGSYYTSVAMKIAIRAT